jgi:MFS transporter, PPP family, 3-phenylpropionic acid transporter
MRNLTPIRALYFFLFTANGVFFSFINVYYHSIGLSGVQIGLINTLAPLIGIFGSTFWGLLSDRLGRTRLLMMIAAGGAALAALGIGAMRTFIWILPLAGVMGLFSSTLGPLLDSANFIALGEHRDRYSHQRIFGTIGFIVTSSTVGLLLEHTGLRFLFVLYAIALGLFILTLTTLKMERVRLGRSMFAGLGFFLKKPIWVVFALAVVVQFVANNGFSNFLSVSMSEMGASDWLVGFVWSASAISELPTMFFGAWLVRKLGSQRMLTIAFAFYALRIFLYSIMRSPEWGVGINLLHSLTYGMFLIGGATFANDLAPDEFKSTSQALFMALMNLAGVIGAPLSGYLFDSVGRVGMYRVQSVISLCALAIFTLGGWWAKRRSQLSL